MGLYVFVLSRDRTAKARPGEGLGLQPRSTIAGAGILLITLYAMQPFLAGGRPRGAQSDRAEPTGRCKAPIGEGIPSTAEGLPSERGISPPFQWSSRCRAGVSCVAGARGI